MRGNLICIFFLLFVFKTIGVMCGCTLSLKDFSKPSPVFIHDNTNLKPNNQGKFIFKRSAVITVACPGNHNYVAINKTTTGYNVVEAHCINNQTFRIDRKFANFNDIKCNRKPSVSTEQTNATCLDGGKIYLVGYKISDKFYSLYESCFDKYTLRTVFVKHELQPTSQYAQTGARPNFMEGDVFGKVRMSNVYKVENQRKRLDEILGQNDIYISKKQFLTRGHLAARADFTLSAEMGATFHYINAAPQWQRENSGDWRLLEDSLRKRAQQLNRSLTVYTGTHDVLTLKDLSKRMHRVYLYQDENNNEIVAVPLYFYKLVYDSETNSATAFVTINSPYYSRKEIDRLVFCADKCPQGWLKWKTDDGFDSFCCDYEEFVEKIGVIENLNVEDEL